MLICMSHSKNWPLSPTEYQFISCISIQAKKKNKMSFCLFHRALILTKLNFQNQLIKRTKTNNLSYYFSKLFPEVVPSSTVKSLLCHVLFMIHIFSEINDIVKVALEKG